MYSRNKEFSRPSKSVAYVMRSTEIFLGKKIIKILFQIALEGEGQRYRCSQVLLPFVHQYHHSTITNFQLLTLLNKFVCAYAHQHKLHRETTNNVTSCANDLAGQDEGS